MAVNGRIIFHGLAILLFLLPLPIITEAQEYGLSGIVQLTYNKEDFDTAGSTTTRSSIEQRYGLNYSGFIYHPRLFSYSIGGTFVKEDGKSDGSDVSAKGKDYNIRLDFIRGTPYPFSLWTTKFTNTSFVPQAEGPSLLVRQTLKSTGLEGSAYPKGLPTLRYSLRQDDRKITGQAEPTDERTRALFLGLNQTWKESAIDLNYNFRNTLYRVKLEEENIHDVNFSGRTRLSKTLTLSENAGFNKNTLTDFTEVSSTTYLEYIPTDRFRGNMNTNYHRIEQPAGKGDFFFNSVNGAYKVSQALTTSGDVSVYYNTGDFGRETAEMLSGGLSYFTPIAKELTLSASTTLGFGAFQGERDKTTMNYNLTSTLSQNLPDIKSNVSTGGSLYYFTSTLGGRTEAYRLNLGIISNYIERLTFQSELRYFQEMTTQERTDSETPPAIYTRILTSDTSLAYFMQLSLRARIEMKAGLLIDTGTTDRRFYYTEGTLGYLIMRNLFMRSILRYMHESIGPSDTISGSINLDYNIRRIFVNLRYELWREKKIDTTNTRATTFLQITRPF
ncbi:MAG: hypothetical protein HZC12_03525 [Nitrospirae bacterium]|nr:hypothetical protein [Nitrospirota bacterium]